MLSDNKLLSAVLQEEAAAIDYVGDESKIGKQRKTLLDYYHSRKYGDEQEGQSEVVTSDVSDVVEGLLPSLLRVFTQGNNIGKFFSETEEGDQEAEDKTLLANWVFSRKNNGVRILHDLLKDALLQFVGVVKIYMEESKEVQYESYKGLSDDELIKLQLDNDAKVKKIGERDEPVNYIDESGQLIESISVVYDVDVEYSSNTKNIKIDNIPPEEFLICADARDFIDPRFIGHRTLKTRSELVSMGFDKDVVYSLPADTRIQSQTERARSLSNIQNDANPSSISSNDKVWLGEYYMMVDVDEDGISERWQVFTGGNQLLKKERVSTHPFAAECPIPMPHQAIGLCPAYQAADIQYINSVLLRQALNNIYQINYSRSLVNDRVDLDDLLTPRAGGVVRVEGDQPVNGDYFPITVQPVVGEILQTIEYMNTVREIRTGVTRYNQGINADTLHETATGFQGIMDASQQRMELMARIFADGGVKQIFIKIVDLLTKYQDSEMQIRVLGKTMSIDPSKWRHKTDCRVDVGLGSGNRQEKITNLSYVLQLQKEAVQLGSPISDESKIYNTLDKLIGEVGLKDAKHYFNDPAVPEEQLLSENNQLKQMLSQMQQEMQNPLIEVEKVRAQSRAEEAQTKADADLAKFIAKTKQENEHFKQNMLARLTEMEAKYNKDIPGSTI